MYVPDAKRCRYYMVYLTLLDSTWLYSTWLYSTWHYSTWHYSTWLYSTWLYSTLLYSTWLYSTWLYSDVVRISEVSQQTSFANDHQLSTVPIFTYAEFFWTSGSLFSWRNISELFSSGFFQDTEPKPHPIHTIQITPHPRHATPNPIHAMPKPGHTAPRQLFGSGFFWTTHGMGPRLKIHGWDWYFILPPEQLCGPPPTYWKLWVQLTPTFEMLKLS